MSTTEPLSGFLDRASSQRNVSLYAAIAVSLPVAYGFAETFAPEGSLFVLLLLGVGVPMVYDEYWKPYDRSWQTVGWVLLASGVATVEFTGLFVAATDTLALSPQVGSSGAFLLTVAMNCSYLVVRHRVA